MTIPTVPALAATPILDAMAAALEAADAFRGATAPNPAVGCTLLDADGRILAVAAHRRAGTAHAEAAAVALCREQGSTDRIATAVVTLEPCNHHGRTPPCTEAILSTPARRVVIGARDPNPGVAGGGFERLEAAGLAVAMIDALPGARARSLAADCSALLAPFRKRMLTGRPYVTVKQALDSRGSMIPPPGSKTFTSEAALRYAHLLRRRADAILTGSGTVLGDDPSFSVRRVPDHENKRRSLIILDRRRRVPGRYLAEAGARGFDAVIADGLDEALDRIAAAGALEVLVEAGPAVLRAVLDGGLWDEHVTIRQGAGAGGSDRAELRRRDGGTTAFDLA